MQSVVSRIVWGGLMITVAGGLLIEFFGKLGKVLGIIVE
jgi:hypothetical protein